MRRWGIGSVEKPEMEKWRVVAFVSVKIVNQFMEADRIAGTFVFGLKVFRQPHYRGETFFTFVRRVLNGSKGERTDRRTNGSPSLLLVPTLISSSPVSL